MNGTIIGTMHVGFIFLITMRALRYNHPSMQQSASSLAKRLTYAGTLPLIIAAVELAVGRLPSSDVLWMASTYSAIIISFLAGIHWACYLFFAQACPRHLLLTSNLVALVAWLSLLVHQHPWPWVLQILCFLYVLTLDYKLHKAALLPTWFYTLRRNATVIVVLSLSIIVSQS